MEIYMQMSRRSGSAAAPRSPFLPLNFFFFFLLFSLWLLYLFVVVEFFSFPCRTTLEMFQLDQFDELESSWLNFFCRNWKSIEKGIRLANVSTCATSRQGFSRTRWDSFSSIGRPPPPPPKADWYWEINLINDGFELMEPEVYHNCVRHSWRFPAIFFCHSRRFLAILPHPFLPSRHPISRFI